MHRSFHRAVASAAAFCLLIGLVFLAALVFAPSGEFWSVAIAGCLFTIPLSPYAWSGALSRKKSSDIAVPPTWQAWVGLFFAAAALSAVFVAIDVAVVHAGFSLILTTSAVALTLVTLPAALRAWLLDRFKSFGRKDEGPNDS
jgi:hypothetical protein